MASSSSLRDLDFHVVRRNNLLILEVISWCVFSSFLCNANPGVLPICLNLGN